MYENDKFKLGDILEDTITGFSGTAFCKSDHINGCRHYHLARKAENIVEHAYASVGVQNLDYQRLKFVKDGLKLPKVDHTWPEDGPNLGDEVECLLSGNKGIVVVTNSYLSGTKDIEIQAKYNKNKKDVNFPESRTSNITYVKVVKKAKSDIVKSEKGFVSHKTKLAIK